MENRIEKEVMRKKIEKKHKEDKKLKDKEAKSEEKVTKKKLTLRETNVAYWGRKVKLATKEAQQKEYVENLKDAKENMKKMRDEEQRRIKARMLAAKRAKKFTEKCE